MSEPYEVRRGQFLISTDPSRLDHDVIMGMLKRSYWAAGRPRERAERALRNSLVFGMYDGEKQIGMARVVTDYSVVAYLCDVFVLEEYRGKGLGKWLVATVLSHPELEGLRRWLLTTDDAHSLYRRYGFDLMSAPETWMERIRPYPPEEGG